MGEPDLAKIDEEEKTPNETTFGNLTKPETDILDDAEPDQIKRGKKAKQLKRSKNEHRCIRCPREPDRPRVRGGRRGELVVQRKLGVHVRQLLHLL